MVSKLMNFIILIRKKLGNRKAYIGYCIAENSKIADPKEIYIWLIIDLCVIYKNRLR